MTQGQAVKFIKEFMGLYNLMNSYQDKMFHLRKETFEFPENSPEGQVECLAVIIYRRRGLDCFIHGFKMGSSSSNQEKPGFLGSLEKFMGWLEALTNLEENKGLRAISVHSLLREIEEYWDKNYLNFALDQRENRKRKMEHIKFVEHHKHVGRNDPCPCGSGKKFKKCCLQ